jgi:hypothetical protein
MMICLPVAVATAAGSGDQAFGWRFQFDLAQSEPLPFRVQMRMPPFLYRCPATGFRVQGFIAEELPADTYEAVACTACQRVHIVNPTTGKVLGVDDE